MNYDAREFSRVAQRPFVHGMPVLAAKRIAYWLVKYERHTSQQPGKTNVRGGQIYHEFF